MSINKHWVIPPKTKQEESDANGKEGADDALINSSPDDSRSDEKVVVNEQRAGKIVNGPSQSAVNTNDGNNNGDDLL